MSDVTKGTPLGGQPAQGTQAVPSTPQVSPTAGQAPAHFYEHKGPKGVETFKTKEDLDKYFRDSYFRQSDYTKKTQEIAKQRAEMTAERESFTEQMKAFNEAKRKYDEWDKILKTRPDVARYLSQTASRPPSAAVAFDRSKEYVEEALAPIKKDIDEYKKWKEEQAFNAKRETIYKSMKDKYPDFDSENIQKTLSEMMDSEDYMEPLIESLYFSQKGRSLTPEKMENKIIQNLQKKQAAGLGSSGGPPNIQKTPEYKTPREAAEAALADLT